MTQAESANILLSASAAASRPRPGAACVLRARPGCPAWCWRGSGWLLLVVGLALAVAYPNLPAIDSLTDYRPKLPLRVFSADGVLLGEFGEERRNFVPIAQIPKVMKDAVLAVEDARFYEHGGVDYKGVAARRAGQPARRAQPGRVDHHDAGGAQLLPVDREDLHAQDLRGAAGAEDREPADQGPDPGGST